MLGDISKNLIPKKGVVLTFFFHYNSSDYRAKALTNKIKSSILREIYLYTYILNW